MNIKTEQIIVFICATMLFSLTLTSNFSASHDSIEYLLNLKKKTHLFNSHHLLFHITSYLSYSFLDSLTTNIKDYYLIEWLNAFWGGASISVFYRILRERFFRSRLVSIISSTIPMFSFGFWFYSTNIEVYIPPILFILTSIFYLTKFKILNKDIYISIIFHVLAIFFHQISIIFTPVILYVIYLNKKRISVTKLLMFYILGGAFPVIIVYFLVGFFYFDLNQYDKILKWILGYSTTSDYWFPLNLATFIKAIYGFGHAVIGGHFLFQIPLIQTNFSSIFFYHNLQDELFLTRGMHKYLTLILFIFTFIIAICIIISFIRVIRYFKYNSKEIKHVSKIILLAFCCYSLFFLFWMPENLEFWILQSVLFWLFLLGNLNNISTDISKNIYLTCILSCSLLFVNYFGSIHWLRNINNDFYFVKSRELISKVDDGDLIVLNNNWIYDPYLKYFGKVQVFSFKSNMNNNHTDLMELIKKQLNMQKKVFIVLDVLYRKSDQWDSTIYLINNRYQNRIQNNKMEFNEYIVID